MTADISDYYITKGNRLPKPEYMWIQLSMLPDNIFEKYNLPDLAHNGRVLVEIQSAIYGLPHAGRIAQERLVKHLADKGYHQCPSTPCLFKHETRPVAFALVVDDFGIKFKEQENADHLINSLQEIYKLTVDPKGERFLGMTIKHDKVNRKLTISMPNYVQMALNRFKANNIKVANSPAIYIPPIYGAKVQQKAVEDTTAPLLSKARKTRIQQIVGTFLYYARAVDPTLLTAINKVASQQANPTIAVEKAAERILQYAKKYPNATIEYSASDMILRGHSDASYLSETKARSRAGGILFLTTASGNATTTNGSIDCFSSIIPSVVASAAEAEYSALFLLGQATEAIRATLQDLGYSQPATQVYCDNKCAVGVATGKTKQKRSKSFDMRLHWIRDRVSQGHFKVEWSPGVTNLADIFTKALAAHKHIALRNLYIKDNQNVSNQRSKTRSTHRNRL
jgi:hypothetical protein